MGSAVEYTIVNVHVKGFTDRISICEIPGDLGAGTGVPVWLRQTEPSVIRRSVSADLYFRAGQCLPASTFSAKEV
jgi:hypothetical protein